MIWPFVEIGLDLFTLLLVVNAVVCAGWVIGQVWGRFRQSR